MYPYPTQICWKTFRKSVIHTLRSDVIKGFTTIPNNKIITIEKHIHNQQRTHHWKPIPNLFFFFPLKYLCHQMHSFGFFHRCISAMKATEINRKTITTRQGVQGNPQLPDCWRSLRTTLSPSPQKGHVCKIARRSLLDSLIYDFSNLSCMSFKKPYSLFFFIPWTASWTQKNQRYHWNSWLVPSGSLWVMINNSL